MFYQLHEQMSDDFCQLQKNKKRVMQVRKLQTSAGDAIACFSAHNKQYGFVAIANICWGKFVNFKKNDSASSSAHIFFW